MKHGFTVLLGCSLCLVFSANFFGVDANSAKSSAQSVPPAIQLEPVLSGLSNPLYLSSANDGTNRLFIVEMGGRILVLQPGTSIPTVFIDITSRVASGVGEQGMLGFVFHPTKEASRRFLVSYTRQPDGATVIAQYRVSAADQNTANTNETVLLVIPQLTTQHHNNVLGRAPDAEGQAFWTARLDDGSLTRGQVLLGFSESAEYKQASFNKVYVTLIYVGMLRRAPEQSGFDFWLDQMNSGASGLQLIQGFLSSTEYRRRFLP